jgi:hypothetical protein
MINQQCVDDPADLHELLPLAAVAGEARDLACRHGADPAQAHFRDHAFEPAASHGAGSRTPEILVHYLDLLPTELRKTLLHGVLQLLALDVVRHLIL